MPPAAIFFRLLPYAATDSAACRLPPMFFFFRLLFLFFARVQARTRAQRARI